MDTNRKTHRTKIYAYRNKSKNELLSLIKLKELFTKYFKLTERSFHICKGSRGKDRLIISSSALRQLLVLKYEIPYGYKSGKMKRQKFKGISKKYFYRLLSRCIETEGCLSRHFSRNKKRNLPRFEFVVKDKNLALDCLYCLKKVELQPTFSHNNNIYKVGLYNHKQVIKLVKICEPFMLSKTKIKHLKELRPNEL